MQEMELLVNQAQDEFARIYIFLKHFQDLSQKNIGKSANLKKKSTTLLVCF